MDAMGAGIADEDLDQVIERYHRALGEFMRGNHEPARELFSEREDITLGNPFGPFARGSTHVVEAMSAPQGLGVRRAGRRDPPV
jgi:hypothetical protein